MERITVSGNNNWYKALERPRMQAGMVEKVVASVFEAVATAGDVALRQYTRRFDGVDLDTFAVSAEEIEQAASEVPASLREAIGLAFDNLQRFHNAQQENPRRIETTPGVVCWRESRPVERVGLYIPGGSAPLFSTVLMLAVPARIAGCPEIALCTPPRDDGSVHPAVLYAAEKCGVNRIFKVGGAQAIAAMAVGTATIPAAYKILGPGNQYVTEAKMQAQKRGIAIDMPAGPSEVLVIADMEANPEFVAADLLSQAEHGPDSQVILVALSDQVADRVEAALKRQLEVLPRRETAQQALEHSRIFVVKNREQAMAVSNAYAPEHLILNIREPENLMPRITAAGSVFVGPWSCESAGDYASGTNHTLPTYGFARNYSGVSLDSFMNKITFQQLSRDGIRNIGPAVERMAEAEALWGHKNAVSLRLKTDDHV